MIFLSEVAPRDGLQGIRDFVPTATKIELVRLLHAAGLRRMEVGSFVSPRAIPQMADTAEVLAAARQLPGLECTVLVPNRRGFEAALRHGAHRLGFFMSVTEGHSRANLNRSVADALEELSQLVRETPAELRIRFNLSTCFHCPFEGVVPEEAVARLIDQIAPLREDMEIALCDTTGNAAPDQVWRVMARAIDRYGPRFAFHGHDTYGMGVANCVAAYEAGCRVIDAAAGGIGGCPYAPGATGNVATEDVVWTFRRMGVETGVDWQRLLAAADFAAAIPGASPGGRLRGVPAARAA
ncbi:MAG: hydroxymethylglutaryl-CoA lyase [Rhodovarius sp.]|nr:hydroxymethylglutaryl-CoA lyase [Rhodovarius sp.]MCX7932022.1 hydroxymethylglutaryl-CoA lyase [Rhodovarius sp.]MDW8315002.1 hydroxymethylglutaryl-CoA lyase [Rhodovarius sp.]